MIRITTGKTLENDADFRYPGWSIKHRYLIFYDEKYAFMKYVKGSHRSFIHYNVVPEINYTNKIFSK